MKPDVDVFSPDKDRLERLAKTFAAELLIARRAHIKKLLLMALSGTMFLVGFGMVWRFYGWRLAAALFVLQFAANLERSNR